MTTRKRKQEAGEEEELQALPSDESEEEEEEYVSVFLSLPNDLIPFADSVDTNLPKAKKGAAERKKAPALKEVTRRPRATRARKKAKAKIKVRIPTLPP